MKSHRECYPEQYTHPLCGKRVRTQNGKVFIVERVVHSRFGRLAVPEGGGEAAYAIGTLMLDERNRLQEEMVAAVRKHAEALYERGWDVVVESWTDEEIIEEVGQCRSGSGAIRKMAKIVYAHNEKKRDIESTKW